MPNSQRDLEDIDVRGSPPPSLYSVDKSVAVLSTELRGFMAEVGRRLDTVDGTIKESLGQYVTKADMKERDEAIADIRGNIKWAVRLVVSAVIIAALAGLFKSGALHG